jgi:hypothetical protein
MQESKVCKNTLDCSSTVSKSISHYHLKKVVSIDLRFCEVRMLQQLYHLYLQLLSALNCSGYQGWSRSQHNKSTRCEVMCYYGCSNCHKYGVDGDSFQRPGQAMCTIAHVNLMSPTYRNLVITSSVWIEYLTGAGLKLLPHCDLHAKLVPSKKGAMHRAFGLPNCGLLPSLAIFNLFVIMAASFRRHNSLATNCQKMCNIFSRRTL